jgi:hypothetical protein
MLGQEVAKVMDSIILKEQCGLRFLHAVGYCQHHQTDNFFVFLSLEVLFAFIKFSKVKLNLRATNI